MNQGCIFIDSFDLFGSRIGGSETFMRSIIRNAPDKLACKVIGTTSSHGRGNLKKWQPKELGEKGFGWFPVLHELQENQKSLIPLSLRFSMALKLNLPDVQGNVLFFNRMEPAVVFRKTKVPKIVVIHNDIQNQMMAGFKSEVVWSKMPKIYFWFEKYIFNSIDHIYTVTENSVRFYHDRYPEWKDKISFLPTWFDSRTFKPPGHTKKMLRKKILTENPTIPDEKKWILYVGRLQKQKAPLRMIDSFAKILTDWPDTILLIVGDGNLKDAIIKRLLTLKLKQSVFFLNYMKPEQLAFFYQAADALLLTSNYEGMPICVLEALGSGLPVVSTKVGEVPRVIKNGFSGEIANSFDAEDISIALKKVLKNPDTYSQQNCIDSVRKYVPEKILVPVYQKIFDLWKMKYPGQISL